MKRIDPGLLLVLVVMGAGWGMTQPLGKIAVSGGYLPLGLVFWQLALGAVILGAVQAVRRQRLRRDADALRVYVVLALIGTVLPNSASFVAYRYLPSGLISILLSFVPMFAFPIALLLGNDRFSWVRIGGLGFGLLGVLLIILPQASLPERSMIAFIPIALIAPFFYGLEGNVVARWGTAGMGPVEVLFGTSLVGAAIALPLALVSGQFIDPRPPWGPPDMAIVASAGIHAMIYSLYVWTVNRAGPVFAVQVSYLVTGFGVLWAMLILGETFSHWIWAAMAVILTGVFLVQPRPREALAELAETGAP